MPMRFVLFALSVALLSLLVGPGAAAAPERASAGTVVIGHDQEPATLNPFITAGNAFATSHAVNPVLAGGMIYNQRAELVPYLLTSRPRIVKQNPLTVTFTYKPTARWSDGRQITGADFVATWRTIMNPNWDIT